MRFTENKILYFANKYGARGLHIKGSEPSTTTLSGMVKGLTSSGHLVVRDCEKGTSDRYATITDLGLITLKLEQLTNFMFEEHEKVVMTRDIMDLMKKTICSQTQTTPAQILDAVAIGKAKSVTGNEDSDKTILKFLNKTRMIYDVGNRQDKGMERRTSEAIRIAKENGFYEEELRPNLAIEDDDIDLEQIIFEPSVRMNR